jgi:hypothetical protein
MERNYPAFDEAKERGEQDGTEWIYGAVETDLGFVPISLRLANAPDGVPQFNAYMDTNGCASRAPLNILETKFTYLYKTSMHPALKAWLEKNGYIENGKVAFNDAFIEILSGTTKQGNSLKAPIEAIRKNGLIPKSALPLGDRMSWDEYMNPARITAAHSKQGREFLRRFVISYEQVPYAGILDALSDDLVDVGGYGWPQPKDGVYPRTELPANHAFACATPAIDALDNYDPFQKRLAADYRFFDWGYSLSITAQNPYPEETLTLFETLQRLGLLAFFAEALRRLVAAPQQTPVEVPAPSLPASPTIPVTIPPAPESKLESFCEAIKRHEGWYPGSRSWRNNNPGNCRYSSVGYASMYGKVGKDAQNFAVFRDYTTGWLYLNNLVKAKIAKHPTWSIERFFGDEGEGYAPASDDNDSKRYAQVVAKAVGLSPTDPMSKIL